MGAKRKPETGLVEDTQEGIGNIWNAWQSFVRWYSPPHKDTPSQLVKNLFLICTMLYLVFLVNSEVYHEAALYQAMVRVNNFEADCYARQGSITCVQDAGYGTPNLTAYLTQTNQTAYYLGHHRVSHDIEPKH